MGAPIEHHHHHIHHDPIPISEPHAPPILPHDPHMAEDVVEKSGGDPPSSPSLLDRLLDTPITAGGFMDTVGLSQSRSKDELYSVDSSLAFANNKLNAGKLDRATSFMLLEDDIININAAEESLYQTETEQINTLNTAIVGYNSQILPTDNAELFALDIETAAYNSGSITLADYQPIVDAYNTYVTGNAAGTGTGGRNAAIQTSITGYQSALNTYNTVDVPADAAATAAIENMISASGLPILPPSAPTAISLQDTALLPVMPNPVPNIPVPQLFDSMTPLTVAPLPTPPNALSGIDLLIVPLIAIATGGIAFYNQLINRISTQEDYNRYYLRGKKIYLPDATIDRTPHDDAKGFLGAPLISVGTGVTSSMHSPHEAGFRSDSIFDADQHYFNLHSGQSPHTHLKRVGLIAVHDAGVLGAPLAIRSMRLNGLTPSAAYAAFGVVGGVTTAAGLTNLVTSGATQDHVQRYVEDNTLPNVDRATKDRLATRLTAEVNVPILLTAGSIAAISLNAPGLPAQIVGNLSGVPPGVAKGALTQPLSPGQVLNDPLSRRFLTTTLAGNLRRADAISNAKAEAIINNALTETTISNNTRDIAQFRRQVIKSLIQQGISEKEATRLADEATTIVRHEAAHSRTVHDAIYNRANDSKVLAQQLYEQGGLTQEAADRLAKETINHVLENKSIVNDSQFAAAVQSQLERRGISSPVAAQVTTSTITAITAGTPTPPPLENPQPTTFLDRHHLGQELTGYAESRLTVLGPDQARRHGQRITEVLVGPSPNGPPSLLDTLNHNSTILLREGGDPASQRLQSQYRDFLSPNLDAFVFYHALMDPANTFLYCSMTSARLAGWPSPKDYIKYLDFYV